MNQRNNYKKKTSAFNTSNFIDDKKIINEEWSPGQAKHESHDPSMSEKRKAEDRSISK